jgi:hypothetical protein
MYMNKEIGKEGWGSLKSGEGGAQVFMPETRRKADCTN